MPNSRPDEMHPDEIVHTLVSAEGEGVGIHLVEGPRVPLEPIPERGGISTAEVDTTYFEAQVDRASIEDGGQTLFAKLHVPEDEWSRLRLDEHLEKDNAEDWRVERYLDCWATKFHKQGDYDPEEYESPVPEDSPLVTAIEQNRFDIDTPPSPFARGTLYYDAAVAESVVDYGNARRERELGDILAVEPLGRELDPTLRDVEDPRDLELPPRPDRPTIDFEELSPLEPTAELLDAVHTINRHAKRLDDEADNHYNNGQGAEAKAASIRKDALYATKTVAIHRFLRSSPSVAIEKHDLNGDVEMYCFEFGRVSFHQPPRAVADEALDAVGVSADLPAEEIDFSPSSNTEDCRFSLSEAVSVVRDAGIDPDEYLRSEDVEDYEYGYFISTTFS